MAKHDDKYEQQISRLLDELAESVWLLKDEELQDEARSAGIDIVATVESLRDRMLIECKTFKQQKLVDARAAYEKKKADFEKDQTRFFVGPGLKALVWNIMTAQPQLQAVTAKFRNLDEITDEDFEAMLRQLIQLKLIDPNLLKEK